MSRASAFPCAWDATPFAASIGNRPTAPQRSPDGPSGTALPGSDRDRVKEQEASQPSSYKRTTDVPVFVILRTRHVAGAASLGTRVRQVCKRLLAEAGERRAEGAPRGTEPPPLRGVGGLGAEECGGTLARGRKKGRPSRGGARRSCLVAPGVSHLMFRSRSHCHGPLPLEARCAPRHPHR